MATVFKGLLKLKWVPQVEKVQYKSHLNVTRPQPPFFKRAVVEKVCVPIVPSFKKIPKHLPRIDMCQPYKKVEENLTEYETVLAKSTWQWISSSKLIAFFHLNYISEEELFQNQLVTKKSGFRHFMFNAKIMRSVLKGGKYESAAVMFNSYNVTIISEEADIQKLLKLTSKLKNLVLMAAIVNDKFLNVKELQYYGEFKNIEQARIQLLSTINAASQNLVQKLNYHPHNFVQILNTIQDQKKDKKDS